MKQPSPCSLNFAALPPVLTDCHVGGLEAAEIEPAVLENDWQLSPAALVVGGNLELPLAAEKNWPLGGRLEAAKTTPEDLRTENDLGGRLEAAETTPEDQRTE